MSVPDTINRLIEKFDQNRDQYTSGSYNEAQLRGEFLDPFLTALGWDLENKQGLSEAYKEVIHEDAIKVGSATKAPDYCLRIGPERKFFVEAKKPSVSIKDEINPAFQLRRYAWSAKLPLSILTDFQEFAVYDCRVKPFKTDKASTARIQLLTYQDYPSRWDEIASIFSRDAVWKGSFDKYVTTAKGKRGTAEVDDAFLSEIESWRDKLARNIALRNPRLSQRELNFAVQKTIDRIIFLRICEDRGIETYGALQALVNGERIYKRLCELYYRADEKYNSGLFHFSPEKERPELPDELTLGLHIDDSLLNDILCNLYYPDCPYEFSVLPAELLGQVYEQFLGKVIRLTKGHQAKVEDKPEVKKAGGVYYTPKYIVDYIVKNTVGKLVEGKSPKQATTLRILDPACGSGSFLIGAYQYLLDWHRDWYTKNGAEKWSTGKNATLYRGAGGDWRLTTAQRKKILLNNIYGVDIDSQAVEVTKLSLLLKVLEGENEQSISQQLKMFHERALPDLGNNIKCGNSLIGPDIFEGQLIVDAEARSRINAFDWKTEFKEVMDGGGFDAVIGNPPYGAFLGQDETEYLRRSYLTASYQLDTYPMFLEGALRLSVEEGSIGLIVPSAWIASKYSLNLRRMLMTQTDLRELAVAPKASFKNAVVETIIVLARGHSSKAEEVNVVRLDLRDKITYHFAKADVADLPELVFPVYSIPKVAEVVRKARKSGIPFSKHVETVWEVKVYQKGKGVPKQTGLEADEKRFHANKKAKTSHLRLVGGSEVTRYCLSWKGMYLDYGPWLAEPRSREWFKGPRILIREVTAEGKIQATLVTEEYVFSNSVDGLRLIDEDYDLRWFLGLLNSSLLSFYHLNTSPNAFKGTFPKILLKDLMGFPLPIIIERSENGLTSHDRMVQMVESMLKLKKDIISAKTDQEKTSIQRHIDATDKQIDTLVYELYGLSEEEIRIVEQANPK